MGFRCLLLLLVTLLLPVLAQASPPDQTWIGGFYDHADYDEAVLFVTSAVGVVESNPLDPSGLGLPVNAALQPTKPTSLRLPNRSAGPSRAPLVA